MHSGELSLAVRSSMLSTSLTLVSVLLADNSLGHHFNILTIKLGELWPSLLTSKIAAPCLLLLDGLAIFMTEHLSDVFSGITSISQLKEAVDHTTLDTNTLRIKFAEQVRLAKALSSMNEEHADEVLINSSKYKVAARDTTQGKYQAVDGDHGPGQVFMVKSEQGSERGSRYRSRGLCASARGAHTTLPPSPFDLMITLFEGAAGTGQEALAYSPACARVRAHT